MANPNPPQSVRFKPGNKANPRGAGAHNKDLKAIRRLSQQEIADVGGILLNNNLEALEKVRRDPASSVFKVWVCQVAIKAIGKGDASSLNILLDRFVGKVKDNINITGDMNIRTVQIDPSQLLEFHKKSESEC